jgi:hypothetical protein
MLRHACGFALANKGHDTCSLQAYLRHKNIQHTIGYTELATNPVQRLLALTGGAMSDLHGFALFDCEPRRSRIRIVPNIAEELLRPSCGRIAIKLHPTCGRLAIKSRACTHLAPRQRAA